MLLRELYEADFQDADAAFCFGRFNPAHQGHIEVWKAVQAAGKRWFVGTNPTTQGANDPLPFSVKKAWMQAIYSELAGHVLAEQSVMTTASKIFAMLKNNTSATIAYVTDSNDWAWAGKLLNDYNGKEGPHGYYKFAAIRHVESPLVSSATALRTAARANDETAFYAASGTDPKLTVNGQTYFETVVNAVQANPEKVKKVAKKKVEQPVEGMIEGALDEFHADLNDKFNDLAPSIEKHKDEAGADRLFKELVLIAKQHNAVSEFKRMLNSARNSAHMDYDTNPGGFENWFWYLPLGNEQGMAEDNDPCWKDYKQVGMKKKGGRQVPNCVPRK